MYQIYNSLNKSHIKIVNKLLRKCKHNLYSTKPAVKENPIEKDLREFERISNIYQKIRIKKPQKPPFAKNLFLGVVDTDILTYPQLEKDELERLDKNLEPANSFFSQPQNKSQRLTDAFIDNLRNLRLFGLQSSPLLGGRELNVTEMCRFNEVIFNNNATTTSLLSNEQFGLQIMLKNGSDEQKKKYLPDLVEGNLLTAFCMAEEATSDPKFLSTEAKLSTDKKTWIINGEKSWVVNGSRADLFIVIAQTDSYNKMGINEGKSTAFLVHRDSVGIISQPCQPMSDDDTDICSVSFCDTIVPAENVIGKVNKGDAVISSLLTELRLSTGSACTTLTRHLLKQFTQYATHSTSGIINLPETDIIRSKVAEVTINLYAMESVLYLTAGLLDQYEKQDCEIEGAIVKVFNSDWAFKSVLQCMNFLGTPSYMKGHWCNSLLASALSHQLLNETNDNVKIIIALLGLQYAGINLNEKIKEIRNPLFYPMPALKRLWTQRLQQEDNPKLTLGLNQYLHPSAVITAQWLEYCVLRLQYATEVMLARHGVEVMGKHNELQRLADSVIDIYAMTASLGRASRAYCIGLQHADYEMFVANAFCLNAMERVKENIRKITAGPFQTNDENYRRISKRVFKFGGYFPEHPLTRNF